MVANLDAVLFPEAPRFFLPQLDRKSRPGQIPSDP